MFCKTVQYHEKSQQAHDIGQFHLSPILVSNQLSGNPGALVWFAKDLFGDGMPLFFETCTNLDVESRCTEICVRMILKIHDDHKNQVGFNPSTYSAQCFADSTNLEIVGQCWS